MTEQSHTVFLSYASQDAPAALRICEALRAAGIAVWFDQSELRGGDAWDQSIRRQIKSCALFIAVISSSTNDRDEGYFRLEWKLAVDRSHLMAADRTFLLPVVVDGTRDDDERVPEHFREVQWTRLPGGETPAAFVERVQRLLAPAAHAPAVRHEVTRPLPAATPPAKAVAPGSRSKRGLFAVAAGVLIVVIALLAAGYFVRRHAPTMVATPDSTAGAAASGLHTAQTAPPKPFNPPADTLVVLPFTNLDSDSRQQYFSDGITEELTNALGQNTKLTVIAWDTASKFRDSHESPNAVGAALDVANLVHGSIEREGATVRVIAELVDTRTGKQLWSDHYDDSAANVFQVQDKISASIADALKVKFASLAPAPTVNPRAHDLVLRARALMDTAHTAAPYEQARTLYEQAIALDPSYTDAHAGLARAWFELTQYSTLALKDALPKMRAEAYQALALDPRNVTALLVLGNADQAEGKLAQARAEYQRALAIDPSDASAHLDYGIVLPMKQLLAQTQKAVQLDPGNASAQNNLAVATLDLGEYAQALPPSLALMKLAPHSADNALGLALTYSLLHRPADAVKAFDLVQPDTPLAKVLVAAGRLTYQSVLDPRLHAPALAAVDALRKRSDLDPFSMGDVLQLDLALGRNATALELLPKMCAAQPIGCSDLSVNPVYLPLHGQPTFQALVKKYDTVSRPPASSP